MLKEFNETFPGWINAPRSFGNGAAGFTKEEADRVAAAVRDRMQRTRGIQEIIVTIEPVEENFYKVVNTSVYESDSNY